MGGGRWREDGCWERAEEVAARVERREERRWEGACLPLLGDMSRREEEGQHRRTHRHAYRDHWPATRRHCSLNQRLESAIIHHQTLSTSARVSEGGFTAEASLGRRVM